MTVEDFSRIKCFTCGELSSFKFKGIFSIYTCDKCREQSKKDFFEGWLYGCTGKKIDFKDETRNKGYQKGLKDFERLIKINK